MGGIMGSFNSKDFENFKRKLGKINKSDIDEFVEGCCKELAARLLAKVIKRTPVGDYSSSSGKTGGTLCRGWTAKTEAEAAGGSGKKALSFEQAAAYVNSLEIKHNGDFISIEIINPVEYASYVEFGHRTPSHKGWVKGKFMLTISEKELERITPKVLEARLKRYFEKMFNV